MATEKIILLKLLPEDVELAVKKNTLISHILIEAGISLQLPCGGAGACGKCKIRFIKGAPPPTINEETLLSEKELHEGVRLACLAKVIEDAQVTIPDSLKLTAFAVSDKPDFKPTIYNPLVRKFPLTLDLNNLEHEPSDIALVKSQVQKALDLPEIAVSNRVLGKIPSAIRLSQGAITVTLFNAEIVDIEPGDTRKLNFALAIDLGTTTVGLLLIDLWKGITLDYAVFPNPQISFGNDLISRISHASQGFEQCNTLKQKIQEKLTEVIEQLCLQHQISPANIYLMAIAGNTVMTQIFWGITPKYVGLYPFKPTVSDLLLQFSFNLFPGRLTIPVVFSFPLIGGFVGGDVVSGMIATNFKNSSKNDPKLLIDIGTNCEVVLKNGDKILAASAPAGPALEGANITYGMRAAPGALIDIRREEQKISWQTIENESPTGICGSGLFHIIDFLIKEKVITEDGLISANHADPFWHKRIMVYEKKPPQILLVSTKEGASRDLFLTQQDIREFQLANGAISSSWRLLCDQLDINPAKIGQIYIAGAFGNYIRSDSLINLGTIPFISKDRIQFVGNSSLEGVRETLLNAAHFGEMKSISKRLKFVELASDPNFQNVFLEHLKLKQRTNY